MTALAYDRGMQNPSNITGLGINVKVRDIQASRRFYESLGFVPVFAYGDEQFLATLPAGTPSAPSKKPKGIHYSLYGDADRKYVVAELELVADHIVLKNNTSFSEVITSPKLSAMIHVQTLLPIITNENVDITFPIRKYYWGSIEVALRDPDGFVLVFITPFTQQEFDAVSKVRQIEVIDDESQLY